jgi:dTDP-4-dehydrorhamnose reductase
MKVLVLGSKGMLGSMLMKVLGDLKPLGWDKEEIDITQFPQVEEKLSRAKPEVIINAAAYTDVDGAEMNRDLAFTVNEEAVRYLAMVAKELDALLIHYSTDYVFTGDKAEGYSEGDAPGPAVNIYGESKLAGEQALQSIASHYYLLRTAWLYGPNGKNFVDTILQSVGSKKRIEVVNDQHGSPTFTKDLAFYTRQMIEGKYEPGIYHATNSGVTTWFEFAQEIFRLANAQVEVTSVASEQFPRPAKRPKYSILTNTKGPQMRPWQEAVKEYISLTLKRKA